MWTTFFHDGGWGMYPTTVFGIPLLAAAGLYLMRPERRWLLLVSWLAVVTFGAGLLGTSVGMVNTFRYLEQVAKAEQVEIAALGCAESLNNLVLGLILVVLAALLTSVGSLRAALAGPARERAK